MQHLKTQIRTVCSAAAAPDSAENGDVEIGRGFGRTAVWKVGGRKRVSGMKPRNPLDSGARTLPPPAT